MSLAHNPQIPTDGLVLCLDAANIKSYVNGDSTWKDLSGQGHNVTLFSEVSFSSEFQGVMDFIESSNSYAENDTFDMTNSNYTAITFCRKTISGNDGRTFAAKNNNWLLGHHRNDHSQYFAEGWIYKPDNTSDTIWRMYTGTGDFDNNLFRFYVNDEFLRGDSNGTEGPNGLSLCRGGSSNQYSNAQISMILVYDRILYDNEIKQIFYSYRGRFNI